MTATEAIAQIKEIIAALESSEGRDEAVIRMTLLTLQGVMVGAPLMKELWIDAVTKQNELYLELYKQMEQ